MPHFTQDLNNLLRFHTQDVHRLPVTDFDDILLRTKPIHEEIKKHYEQDTLSVLSLCKKNEDIEEFSATAEYYRMYFDDIIILGTGGSSLGSRALLEVARHKKNTGHKVPNLHIVTNTDPFSYHQLCESLDFHSTAIIAISKSGNTIETLMQLMILLPILKEKISPQAIKDQVCVITQSENSALFDLAKKYQWRIHPHDPTLSGRYSVLSIVGLMPALIMGLNVHDIRKGAQDVLEEYTQKDYRDVDSIKSAAMIFGLVENHHKSCLVMLAYASRLGSLSRWFRQLWAESIGKSGHGSTPIYAMGPVDQHSQLQLWLDGPADKIFTFFSIDHEKNTHLISAEDASISEKLLPLSQTNLNDLMDASAKATFHVLNEKKLPIRQFHTQQFNEKTMGALMMHFMLETIHTAKLYGFNPFDQPAVEEGKKLIWQNIAKI